MTAEQAMARALWEASEKWTLDLPRDFDPDKADQPGAPRAILAALRAAGWAVVPVAGLARALAEHGDVIGLRDDPTKIVAAMLAAAERG